MFEIKTNSESETREFAEQLAAKLAPGDVLTLEGDLGAGKTMFTKGLAKGLGITRNVNSPTFTVIKEYKGKYPLYHMDVYRLNEEEDLGFDEYFNSEGITVIEWAKRIQEQLPSDRLDILIKKTGEESRRICLNPRGQRFESVCKELDL